MTQTESKSPSKLPKYLRDTLAMCLHRPEQVLFLDIETTGLSHYYDEITVIGWSLDGCSHSFVKGDEVAALFRPRPCSTIRAKFSGESVRTAA